MIEEKIIQIRSNSTIFGICENDRYIDIVHGEFEKRFQQLFNELLPRDAVVFDIGANIGIVSIIIERIRPGSKIYSFEAGKGVFDILQKNLRNNYCRNINAYNLAVADFNGDLSFSEDSAYGHAVDEYSDDIGVYRVPCLTIDSLVHIFSRDRVDFIKIDIEGFEPQALVGAKGTISKFNPIFLMEINPWCLRSYGGHDPVEFVSHIFNDFEYTYVVNKNDWTLDSPIIYMNRGEFLDLMKSDELYCGDLLFSNNILLCEIASRWI